MLSAQMALRILRHSANPWRAMSTTKPVTVAKDNDTNHQKTVESTESSGPEKKPDITTAGGVVQKIEIAKLYADQKEKPETLNIGLSDAIANAKTVKDLLSLADNPQMDRYHALSIVSRLAKWTVSKNINSNDYERNPLFTKICRYLSNQARTEDIDYSKMQTASPEFKMILSVTAEDEAAKMVKTLSLTQMVKVMAGLAEQKSRSPTLLRSLAYSITTNANKLTLKQCSDVLYSLTILNVYDSMLLTRVSNDIQHSLQSNHKPAVVEISIFTSLGYLRFKDKNLLDDLTKWIIDHHELCRPKDLVSVFLTLAAVNYKPLHADDLRTQIIPGVKKEQLSETEWLDYVWALSLLGLAETKHFESVLSSDFIKQLVKQSQTELATATRLKLLNINAVAKHIVSNYNGPFLSLDDSIYSIPYAYRKSKQILVDGLLEALKQLFNDHSYVRTRFNSKMGFLIDAECVLSKKRIPLDVEQNHPNAYKIAFVVLDFHDMCQGTTNEPAGIASLAINLLEKVGYKVLVIPHNEFNTSDKILKRVQYLDEKLKRVVEN